MKLFTQLSTLVSKIALIAALLGLTACASTATDTDIEPKKVKYLTYVKPGQPMPVTQFTDTQGNRIDLARSDNNKLVVLFATWCHDSQRAIKAIVKRDLANSENIDLIAIGREENKASLDKFAKTYGTNFPLIADENRAIYSQFANAGVPRLILLDGQNRIVKTIIAEGKQPLAEVVW